MNDFEYHPSYFNDKKVIEKIDKLFSLTKNIFLDAKKIQNLNNKKANNQRCPCQCSKALL